MSVKKRILIYQHSHNPKNREISNISTLDFFELGMPYLFRKNQVILKNIIIFPKDPLLFYRTAGIFLNWVAGIYGDCTTQASS